MAETAETYNVTTLAVKLRDYPARAGWLGGELTSSLAVMREVLALLKGATIKSRREIVEALALRIDLAEATLAAIEIANGATIGAQPNMVREVDSRAQRGAP